MLFEPAGQIHVFQTRQSRILHTLCFTVRVHNISITRNWMSYLQKFKISHQMAEDSNRKARTGDIGRTWDVVRSTHTCMYWTEIRTRGKIFRRDDNEFSEQTEENTSDSVVPGNTIAYKMHRKYKSLSKQFISEAEFDRTMRLLKRAEDAKTVTYQSTVRLKMTRYREDGG